MPNHFHLRRVIKLHHPTICFNLTKYLPRHIWQTNLLGLPQESVLRTKMRRITLLNRLNIKTVESHWWIWLSFV